MAVRNELVSDADPHPLVRQRFGGTGAFGGESAAQFGNCARGVDIESSLWPEDIREFAVRSNLHIVTWAAGSV